MALIVWRHEAADAVQIELRQIQAAYLSFVTWAKRCKETLATRFQPELN
jgi:hypothetical protein